MAKYDEFEIEDFEKLREDMTQEQLVQTLNENFRRLWEHFVKLAETEIA